MTFSRRTVVFGLVTAALWLGGVAASAWSGEQSSPLVNPASASSGEVWKRTELYFGTGKPDGSEVTPDEFERFSEKEITGAFPDGFTELTAQGQFRGADGQIVREHSFVVIVLYPFPARAANREIEAIRTDYKRLFQQESVLRTDSVGTVSF